MPGLSVTIRGGCALLRLAQALSKIKEGWHRTVATVQIALRERLLFARAVVTERVEPRAACAVLLGEPDLVTPEQPRVEHSRVVGVHNKLRTMRVGFRAVKQLHQTAHQQRVQAIVDLIDRQHLPTLQRQNDRPGDAEEPLSAK